MNTAYDTVPASACVQNGKADEPGRILFVCTGNTCRSPMAAALYNDMRRPQEVCSACPEPHEPGRMVAFSAGLYANEGEPISADALRALQEAGVRPVTENDYTLHRAQNVSGELIDSVDLVVAISGRHAMELMLRFPESAGKITTLPMDISDPFGRGIEAYRQCLMQLRYCLQLMQAQGGER